MGGKRGRLVSESERMQTIELIKEAVENGARKHKACDVLEISVRTLERWEKPNGCLDNRKTAIRPIQANQLSPEERQNVIDTANSAEYRNLPPSKIVPLLADNGKYIASESTFYRILREEKQLTHRQRSKPSKHSKPRSFTATKPNQVWSWDISYLPTNVKGIYFYLYAVVDIYSRKLVAWSIHDRESSELGAALVKQACIDEKVDSNQLVLHSDNGKPMKGLTMLAMLEQLGVLPSFSRPSVSDDNPFSESLFKTIKYHPTFPYINRFDTIEAARDWMESFTHWYNTHHLHSGIKFVTPEQRHTGQDQEILNKRHQIYTLAKRQRPERWTGNTRNWIKQESVTLNPDRKSCLNSQAASSQVLEAA